MTGVSDYIESARKLVETGPPLLPGRDHLAALLVELDRRADKITHLGAALHHSVKRQHAALDALHGAQADGATVVRIELMAAILTPPRGQS